MALSPDSREVSLQRIRAAARTYDRQKQLAQELGTTDSTLSKYLNEQLPKLCALLDLLGLEVVPQGHLADLKRVLKETL
jgi:transcriptional regulator with XRE-family HTH domain